MLLFGIIILGGLTLKWILVRLSILVMFTKTSNFFFSGSTTVSANTKTAAVPPVAYGGGWLLCEVRQWSISHPRHRHRPTTTP